MPRRKRPETREIPPEYKYGSALAHKFINCLMKDGKKGIAQKIFHETLETIEKKTGKPGFDVFNQAMENVKPVVEVKPRRIGGATYQVPMEVRRKRRISLAIRWIVDAAKKAKGKPMYDKLADEIIAASKREGSAIKKKEDTHRMAEANRVFAQFKW
ncbi:30S ribosomal protein S7 [candidate division WOR-3 bacterium JGI_Cruoil_03_44_89]|uniref:Small ribosomal subunit protein uS7 n=1 Tax=candidate division WOR-3 bacterium JGI_Cruoil_03_44_89 TaxID=1973748 RepID=A0A235BTV3_UNCW3|nr:MAG: 30S ribosomal protein S7 [candidate division WOR-3 bacterium JGI_Cruoil_03_44_89]